MLTNANSLSYFCILNFLGGKCSNYSLAEEYMNLVTTRAWGVEAVVQEGDIELMLSNFPELMTIDFPGSIISFFTNLENIFV
jgi:hypothetical protein